MMDGLQSKVLRTALFSALGLLPLACGGSTTSDGDSGGSGGATEGGSTSTRGGSTSQGGKSTRGGATSTNGGGTAVGGASSTGGTASTNGGATTTAGGSTSQNAFPCNNPRPLVSAATGYVICDNGSVQRPKVAECPSSIPRPDVVPNPTMLDTCTKDADCTDQPFGYCLQAPPGAAGAFCQYGCVKDSDCGSGQICLCGDPVGRCAVATCTFDGDCEPGYGCQSYDGSRGCDVLQFACQTPQDTCGGVNDCAGTADLCGVESGGFTCLQAGCAIGRPFLVDSVERVAEVIPSSGWQAPLADLELGDVPIEIRQRAAASWQRIAQMEHASVAAFARFALQLLSLGAPAELLELTTRAMSDEIDHARRAFAVASRYAGAPLGPAPLKVDDSCGPTSLLEIVRLTLLEGCIGETVAALEALELSETVAPALRDHLATLARDETRHAELAFRFLRWALANGDPDVAACVRSAINSVRSELRALRSSPSPGALDATEAALLAHGVLSDRGRRASRSRALGNVVLPCLEGLLGAEPSLAPEPQQQLSANA